MTLTTDAVLERYDELVALVDSLATRPAADPSLVGIVAPQVLREARLLDAGAFELWLEQWTDDAVLWVPHGAPVHPAHDQSLLLDDRRRIGERVQWRREPSAWGQQPASTTVRVIGGIECWRDRDRVVVRSALVLHEQRRHRSQQLVGHQVHEYVGDDLACRTKVLVFPQLELGVRNPSFLL